MTEEASTLGPLERDRRTLFAIGERERSWGDLLADAARISARLTDVVGATKGDRASQVELMLACADRYTSAATLLAIWGAGATAALPPNGREETIDALCAERQIATVLHDGGGQGGLDVRPALGDGGAELALPRFEPSQQIVCLYTSGSTGAHVACPKTARQLLGEARLLAEFFGMGPGTRVLATVPPHHIYGLLFGVLVPLMGGGALVRSMPHHAETIAAEARRARADVLCSVPAHLYGLTALAAVALPPLRRIFSSGAPLPGETARAVAALAGTPVVEILGSSETGGIAWREGGRSPAWQPFPGIEVTADSDGVMRLSSPFAPMTSDDAGGPARGGDRIALVGGGRFELLGRTDGVVKIGGSRIALAEIERRLVEIAGVREAAVLAVDVPGLRQHELWAVVVAPDVTEATLREALLRRVEAIAVPRRFRFVATLPREENGKLVRARMLALFAPNSGDASVSPEADGPAPAREDPPPTSASRGTPTREDPPLTSRREPVLAPGREREEVKVIIAADSPFFRGHFESFPVLPGVVQLNNLVLESIRARWPALGRLERVVGLKFRRPIRPGDALAIVLDLLDLTEQNRVAFEIRRAEAVMSSGTFVFASTNSERQTPGSER